MQTMIKRLRDMMHLVFICERNCARATEAELRERLSCMRASWTGRQRRGQQAGPIQLQERVI